MRWTICLATSLLYLSFSCSTAVHGAGKSPNIVFILADDLGRECLESYGGTSYRTPNLNRLAEQGTRFECCYATPMCSPTRVMLMTGRYSFHNYRQWGRMDLEQPTLASVLQHSGYHTAVSGKWHLGGWDQPPYGPTRTGFGRYATFDYEKVVREGGQVGNQFWNTEIWKNGQNYRLNMEYGPAWYRRQALDFIREHAARNSPAFFLYYPLVHAHRPFVPTDHVAASAKERTTRNGKLKYFPAMVSYIDEIVGTVLDTLETTGQLENTVIFFAADNGTDNVGEAKELRSQYRGTKVAGGKYLPTELGANVPLLVRGPGVRQGRVVKLPVDFTDMLPTLCEIAETQCPSATDGESLWPMLQGAPETGHDGRAYTWGVFEHSSKKYKTPATYQNELIHVVRDGRWKLLSTGELFDLADDWQEQTPLPNGAERASRMRLRNHLDQLRSSASKLW
ncbi:MAG: sulfatase-like hydrolase/transferase [Fuerstiella sp.]|nr:sulfatase-like hydrolase/transferase [Fuerstiella sp.]